MSPITISTLPLCQPHNQRARFICQEPNCQKHIINCGDCLYDFHADHVGKLLKIENVLQTLSEKYVVLQDKKNLQIDLQESLNQLGELNEMEAAAEKLECKVLKNIDTFKELVRDGAKNKITEVKSLTSGDYQNLLQFFENFTINDVPKLQEKILIAQKLQENMSEIEKNSEDASYIKEKVEKFKNEIVEVYDRYQKAVSQISEKHLLSLQKLFDQDIFNFQKVRTWNYSFDKNTLNKLSLDADGNNLTCSGGCSKDKKVLSKETLPNSGCSYWEIIKTHTSGCYDSIGVCTNYQQRNGTTSSGWAVRCYGSHSDFEFTGSHHNGEKSKFYENWNSNDKIGLLYNSQSQSLSYFVNGNYIGTPFKNVNGDQLFFIVEGCHLGGFKRVEDAKLPDESQLKRAEDLEVVSY